MTELEEAIQKLDIARQLMKAYKGKTTEAMASEANTLLQTPSRKTILSMKQTSSQINNPQVNADDMTKAVHRACSAFGQVAPQFYERQPHSFWLMFVAHQCA